jgi:hypothetical protein
MLKEGINEVGKDILNVYRIHDKILSSYLRKVQNEGKFIISVIPLFRQKKEEVKEQLEDDLEGPINPVSSMYDDIPYSGI